MRDVQQASNARSEPADFMHLPLRIQCRVSAALDRKRPGVIGLASSCTTDRHSGHSEVSMQGNGAMWLRDSSIYRGIVMFDGGSGS
jgi:hypothetical protein